MMTNATHHENASPFEETFSKISSGRSNEMLGKTNCNKILAIFLKEMKEYVQREFYQELVFFILMYRKALNEEGWQKLREMKGINGPAGLEFCNENDGELMPEICNSFILNLLPRYLEEYSEYEFLWLGLDDERMKNAVFFTHHLCNWLFVNRFTKARVSLDL
eukprot:TRINITY_DN2219_c0_g2_i2.p1 TRINITY_DN2219_c0_g2~~TRINITY_DN2219_c0_g2_i2.p1  ORF type:complete len:163 (-),score=35.12 TRINITY_DN2219_c0_g2_i2:61-549(-)